jgi:hypothetical protein
VIPLGAQADLSRAAERATRVYFVLRGIECAAAGSLGGAVVFAAGIVSGAEGARSLLIVAALIALLTALLVWSERRPRARQLVLRTDRRAGLDGALAAVLDVDPASAPEHDSASDAMPSATHGATLGATLGATHGATHGATLGALLAARVRERVRPLDFVLAAWPRSPLALAAPLLGAALVAIALDYRPDAPVPRADVRLAGTVASLRGVAERRRAAGDAGAAEALEIAARAVEGAMHQDDALESRVAESAAIERTAPDPAREDPRSGPDSESAATRAARDHAATELERIGESAGLDDALRAELARAAAALRGESDPQAQALASSGVASTLPTGVEPGPGDRSARPPGDPAHASRGDGLANHSGGGRMLGPPRGGESDPRSSDPTGGTVLGEGPGRGVASARWWPSRYDVVVERYLTP